MDWKSHKQQCKGRVEAAKLTTEQLDQLDLLVTLNTGGTREFPDANHHGKFPEDNTHAGWEGMLQLGQEAARARSVRHAELAKLARKEKEKRSWGQCSLKSLPNKCMLLREPEQTFSSTLEWEHTMCCCQHQDQNLHSLCCPWLDI